MPPTTLSVTEAAQSLGNDLTRHLDGVHDDDALELKAAVKNTLCELEELVIGLPLGEAHDARQAFVTEVLENLAGIG